MLKNILPIFLVGDLCHGIDCSARSPSTSDHRLNLDRRGLIEGSDTGECIQLTIIPGHELILIDNKKQGSKIRIGVRNDVLALVVCSDCVVIKWGSGQEGSNSQTSLAFGSWLNIARGKVPKPFIF